MNTSLVVDIFFWIFAAGGVVAGWLVFRTDSMVRAAYWLLASFVCVGAILLLLAAEFLGLVLILMMAGEMTIMAIFMVMFMMNPAGLNPMQMVHQHRTSIAVGLAAFAGLAIAGIATAFPDATAPPKGSNDVTAELGVELLGDSMLVFQTAGVALLATMIGAIALTSHRGRFGDAHAGCDTPSLDEPVHDRSVEATTSGDGGGQR
jgi:NADH-quinone oxidoreductase subunit J